jgi:hypothetical protein
VAAIERAAAQRQTIERFAAERGAEPIARFTEVERAGATRTGWSSDGR